MLKYVCLAMLVAVVSAGEMKFQDCGHHEVSKLLIDGCSGDLCVIHQGGHLKIEGSAVSNQDTKTINVQIIAKIAGLEVPIPGIEHDGCKYVKCPLTKGQNVELKYEMTIPKLTPLVKADVTTKITGEHGLLACVIVHGKVEK